MRVEFCTNFKMILLVQSCLVCSSLCHAISSKVVRHSSSSDLLKGKVKNTVISSRGTIQLGRSAEAMKGDFEEFANVWSINSIVANGKTIYFGTSPNGGIYKYASGRLTKIYPIEEAEDEPKTEAEPESEPEEESKPEEEQTVIEKLVQKIIEAEKHLSNEHIFAMATDASGRLLAGISGKECKLCRFEDDEPEVIFEPDDAKYIFAIAVDSDDNIFLGTGPEGKIYKFDSRGKKGRVFYDSRDKNIMSLAIGRHDGIYAGTDGRGLVYKIDPKTEKATVIYDSEQPEITALLSVSDSQSNAALYAAATSAKIVQTQTQFAVSAARSGYSAGRPDTKAEKDNSSEDGADDLKLEIANTEKPKTSKPTSGRPPVSKGAKPSQASHIYAITKDGFVTDIFGEAVIFFCLADQDGTLLAGTGNSAKLFSIDPKREQQAVIYEDEQAVQITAIALAGDDAYLGTANPAKVVKLSRGFAAEGTYISDLIDAGQPAKWGKLQLEADIPKDCQVLMSARSGNVKDVNDPTFSQWTEPVVVTEPVQLDCPLGRFCQYKLLLQSRNGAKSPLIREIAVASTVPNLAPKVTSVAVSRTPTGAKKGFFKISYATRDANGDKLIYKIEFRKIGRTNWIELKDKLEAASFEWDGKTVEDGRYEVRITASDERSNTVTTKLADSRVSEPIVVDNTGPAVSDIRPASLPGNDEKYKVFKTQVSDELSAIGKLEYTIDSNADWISTIPDDLVYDTTKESFTIRVDKEKKLPAGDHVLTIKVSDAVGNTTYKTFEISTD